MDWLSFVATGAMFSVEPKRPIRCNNYICDKTFQLQELDELQRDDENEQTFGVAFINGRQSEFYLVSDLQVRLLGIVTATTMNHHRRGGSSSARLARLRENKIDHNVAYIADEIEKHFAARGTPLLIGGCAEFRTQVLAELNCDVIGSFPWQGYGLASAQEFFESNRDVIDDCMRKKEQLLLEPLWKVMNTSPELLLYGTEIETNACDTVYYNAKIHSPQGPRSIPVFYSDSLDTFGGRIGIASVKQ